MRLLHACVATLLLISSAVMLGQGRASVSGTVKDPSGLDVNGATVTLTNTATTEQQIAKTNVSGFFALTSVSPGKYDLTVTVPGFAAFVSKGILVQVDEDRSVPVALAVGKTGETIEVNSDVNAQVDMRSSALTQVIDSQSVLELPLDGRNPLDLQSLVAGSGAESDGNAFTDQAENRTISINGNRPNSNNYTLDNADNEDSFFNTASVVPNPDALDQFSIRTSNYDASQGRNGGAQIDAIIKSGTNEWHGSAFEYARDTSLDAYPFNFQGTTNLVKPGYRRHQFGGSLGGPVIHDKVFFFAAYQGTRQNASPNDETITVLSDAERTGDFSELCSVFDPTTHKCTTGTAVRKPNAANTVANRLPYNDISAYIYQPMLDFINAYVPHPNGGNNTYTFSPDTTINEDQYILRIDARLGAHDDIYGHFVDIQNDSHSNTSNINIPGFLTDQNYTTRHTAVNETHVFTPNLTNIATFGDDYIYRVQQPINPDNRTLTDFGTGLVRATPGTLPGYAINAATLFHVASGYPLSQLRPLYQYSDLATWTHGLHQVTFGADFRDERTDQNQTFRADAMLAFTAGGTGFVLADLLTGVPNQLMQQSENGGKPRRFLPDAFINDDWKATSRLTLNIGMRWEPFRPEHDALNQLSQFRPGVQSVVYPNAPVGLVFSGDPSIPVDGYNSKWWVFSPRVGFAYNLFGNGNTSLRAAFGVYNTNIRGQAFNNNSTNVPFSLRISLTRPSKGLAAPYYDLGYTPFPYAAPTAAQASTFTFPSDLSLSQFDPKFRQSRVEQWNVSIQQQLPGQTLLMIAYVGNNGEHLFAQGDGNAAVYGTTAVETRRPFYPAVGAITELYSDAHSKYEALQATITRRFSKGVSILANYTWSKSIDNASLDTDVYPNPFDHSFSRGLSDFDLRGVFNGSFIWHLPEPSKSSNVLVRALGDGWSTNAIIRFQSGNPFSFQSSVSGSADGASLDLADRIGPITYYKHQSAIKEVQRWFDTTSFVPDAPNTFGNSGRNSLIGPGYENINFSMSKEIVGFGHTKILLRGEAFNLFNHTNPGIPEASTGSGATNGQILSYYRNSNPRLLQLAARLNF